MREKGSVAALAAAMLSVASALLPAARAVEYVPIYNLSLMGGQYFFAGERASLSGNAAGNIVPVVKFNERWTLLPVYNVSYQGTKQVTDSVGAGTLYQQMMDHRLAFTGIYTSPTSNWKFRPSVGYKREFLKETRDETWGKGLFDYWKTGAGFEAENVYQDPFSYRIGYDFYYIRFPNFQSLESKTGLDPNGNPLGRGAAGTDTLDTYNSQLSASVTRPFPYDEPKVSLQAGYSINWQTFRDQPIIVISGQPISRKRQDFIQTLSLGAAYPKAFLGGEYRLVSRVGMGLSHDGSNQNDFDAARLQYIPDAYSYYSWSMGPSCTLSWGDEREPNWVSMGFTFSRTQYMGRLAQNSDGLYLGEKQYQDRYLLSLGYSLPIAPHFSLKTQANFLWAESNMAYQATYRYTYNTANYLLGFTYDY